MKHVRNLWFFVIAVPLLVATSTAQSSEELFRARIAEKHPGLDYILEYSDIETRGGITSCLQYNRALMSTTDLDFTRVNTTDPVMTVTMNDFPDYSADVFILSGAGDGLPLNNPVIIGDPFDAFDTRDLKKINSSQKYYNLTWSQSQYKITIHYVYCNNTEDYSDDETRIAFYCDDRKMGSFTGSFDDTDNWFGSEDFENFRAVNQSYSFTDDFKITIHEADGEDLWEYLKYFDENDHIDDKTLTSADLGTHKSVSLSGDGAHYTVVYSLEAAEVGKQPYTPGKWYVKVPSVICLEPDDYEAGTTHDEITLKLYKNGTLIKSENRGSVSAGETVSFSGFEAVLDYSDEIRIQVIERDDWSSNDELEDTTFTYSAHMNQGVLYKTNDKATSAYVVGYEVYDLGVDKRFTSPRDMGYDVVFINFRQGAGDIRLNAMLQLRVIEEIERIAGCEYFVGGISMSGIIGRLALLYSLPHNNTDRTKLANGLKGFFTVDSPHQGASIGTIQSAMWKMLDDDWVGYAARKFGNYSAADQYAQLCVPGAHQMLYAHYYPDLGTMSETVHDQFYGMLKAIGDYRDDIPMASIATSNFHLPHGGLDVTANIGTGKIDAGIAERSFNAGGSQLFQQVELYPGSVGQWYWDYGSGNGGVDMVYTNTINGETYKGTFMPINSVLDLRGYDVFGAADRSPATLAYCSPFDKVCFLENEYNRYHNRYDVDAKRYDHITFDFQVMQKVQEVIEFLEVEGTNFKAQRAIPAIMALLSEEEPVDAGAPNTVTTVPGSGELIYAITYFPEWSPVTTTIQVQATGGVPMDGTIRIGSSCYSLNGWSNDIKVQYAGAPIQANIKSSNGNPMSVTYWHDNSTIAAPNGTGPNGEMLYGEYPCGGIYPPAPPTDDGSGDDDDISDPDAVAISPSEPVYASLATGESVTYTASSWPGSDNPDWNPNVVVQIDNTGGGIEIPEGTVEVNGTQHALVPGWNSQFIDVVDQGPYTITVTAARNGALRLTLINQ